MTAYIGPEALKGLFWTAMKKDKNGNWKMVDHCLLLYM